MRQECVNCDKLRERLRAADDVVSYLVIFGAAAPIDRLSELVAIRMQQRVRDKETLCVPSAVEAALKGVEVDMGAIDKLLDKISPKYEPMEVV